MSKTVKPIAAANAKIPKAQASDSAIRARSDRAVTVPGGSVVWMRMCTVLILHVRVILSRSPLTGFGPLLSSGFTCLLLIANETVSFSAFSRTSGIAIRTLAGVFANTIPRSSRKARNWLITAVRRAFSRSRTRWIACSSN